MSRFYGDERIEDKVEDGDHYILQFKSGKSARVSKKMFDVSATRDSTDLTNLWDRQLAPVAREVLQTLLSWDIKLAQLDHLFNILKQSLEHNHDRAIEILYGKKKEDRTMSDIDRILTSIQNDGEQKGTGN